MTEWFADNLGTIMGSLIIAAIVILIVANNIKRRKKGCHCS